MTSPSQGTWQDSSCRRRHKAFSSPNSPKSSNSDWNVGWKRSFLQSQIWVTNQFLSFWLSILQLAHTQCHFITTSKYFKGNREDLWTGLMSETYNWAPQYAVSQTLPLVLGRFSNLPHTAPGLRLKSANILLQKCTKETPPSFKLTGLFHSKINI